MVFFGWGSKNKQWSFEDKTLLCQWSYFHIFFCPVAFNKQWYILADARSEDRKLSKDEASKISKQYPIGIFNQWGLFIAIGILWIIGMSI